MNPTLPDLSGFGTQPEASPRLRDLIDARTLVQCGALFCTHPAVVAQAALARVGSRPDATTTVSPSPLDRRNLGLDWRCPNQVRSSLRATCR